jgi:hypothetical protein
VTGRSNLGELAVKWGANPAVEASTGAEKGTAMLAMHILAILAGLVTIPFVAAGVVLAFVETD